MRRSADTWFAQLELRPRIVGEFDDSATLKAFARAGAGLLIAPKSIEGDLRSVYGLLRAGVVTGVSEQVYAITVERRVKHPAVLAILAAAKAAARHGA